MAEKHFNEIMDIVPLEMFDELLDKIMIGHV